MLSIITINYNDAIGLENTIKSIANQTYSNIEYIVVDGGSNDESLSIIKKYEKIISYWISEKDNGIYHAMNKGIKASNNEYLLFLNSGDVLCSPIILDDVKKKIDKKFDIYYGDLIFKSTSSSFTQKYPTKLNFSFFLKESLPHPASFIRRNLFDKIFYYSEDYKIVSDWEFFICAICKLNVTYKYLGQTISVFSLDGISNNPENKKLIASERTQVLQKHFPTFIQDYQNISLLENNRFKMLKVLESNRFTRKLNSVWLRILLYVTKRETPKQL